MGLHAMYDAHRNPRREVSIKTEAWRIDFTDTEMNQSGCYLSTDQESLEKNLRDLADDPFIKDVVVTHLIHKDGKFVPKE